MQQINITFDPDRSKESYKRFFRYERQQELKRMPIKLIILICCSLILSSCQSSSSLHETLMGKWESRPNPSGLVMEFQENQLIMYNIGHEEESRKEFDYEIVESEETRLVIALTSDDGISVGNTEVTFYPSPDSITLQVIEETPGQSNMPSTLYRVGSSVSTSHKQQQEQEVSDHNTTFEVEYHMEGRVKSLKVDPKTQPYAIQVHSCPADLKGEKIYLTTIDSTCVQVELPGSDKAQDTLCFGDSYNSESLHFDLKRNNDRGFVSTGGRFFIIVARKR